MLFTCIVIFFIKDTLFSLKFQMSKFIFLYIFCFQLILCKNPNPRGLTIFQVCFFCLALNIYIFEVLICLPIKMYGSTLRGLFKFTQLGFYSALPSGFGSFFP